MSTISPFGCFRDRNSIFGHSERQRLSKKSFSFRRVASSVVLSPKRERLETKGQSYTVSFAFLADVCFLTELTSRTLPPRAAKNSPFVFPPPWEKISRSTNTRLAATKAMFQRSRSVYTEFPSFPPSPRSHGRIIMKIILPGENIFTPVRSRLLREITRDSIASMTPCLSVTSVRKVNLQISSF